MAKSKTVAQMIARLKDEAPDGARPRRWISMRWLSELSLPILSLLILGAANPSLRPEPSPKPHPNGTNTKQGQGSTEGAYRNQMAAKSSPTEANKTQSKNEGPHSMESPALQCVVALVYPASTTTLPCDLKATALVALISLTSIRTSHPKAVRYRSSRSLVKPEIRPLTSFDTLD